MVELIERVSDIVTTPVIRKIWQVNYRQILVVCLACLFVSLCVASEAQEDKISRYSFVASLYERVYNRQVTEMEAVNSGLVDAFDDGSYHLEWPVSRGMVVEALYRLSVQSGTAVKLPRAFADITADSLFKKPLESVGGAFLPLKHGRFDPNYLLNRQVLFHALKILLDKGVLKQEDRSELKILPVIEPAVTQVSAVSQAAVGSQTAQTAETNGEVFSIKPDLGFKEKLAPDGQYKADAYARIAAADSRVTPQQMNPQTMASIEDASSAMADVDSVFERMGGSIMEMTSSYPMSSEDEQVLRQGLAEIEAVLETVINRFEYSKLQLTTVTPVDPGQVEKCNLLNSRLKTNLEQARLLKKRIAARLAEPQKEAE